MHGVAAATAPTAASAAGAAAATTTAATPTAGGTAATKAHAASGSADGAPVEPEHQRAAAAPNTVQRIGPCSATPQTGRGLPGARASGDSDDETDEFTLDAAAVVAEEAVERKEARRVKPWLSELDVPEWQELAGDRLGWRKMLKSIKIRT